MMANERIQRFYKDIQGLDIRFPVSAIAQATGETKGNVSKYLNQKMQPSESFLNRFYMKFGKVVQKSDTTKAEMPQNGTKSEPQLPTTRIGKVVWEVKHRTGMTNEQVADRIKYSRQRLQALIKEGDSQKVYDKLQAEFKDILNDMTTSTAKPNFDVKSPNGSEKDAVIKTQANTVHTLAETSKSQQETISKLTDLVTKLVYK